MGSANVLLVDNDLAIRSSLSFSLGLEGFAVETYDSGEELLLEAILPPAGCLVLDYNLPTLDGLSLLKLLRRQGVTLPAIVITSNPTRKMRARVAEAGALLVEKPLLSDCLTRALRSLSSISEGDTVQQGSGETMTFDAITDESLAAVVDVFYGRVRQDRSLGPIFDGAIGDWPAHLSKLEAFWSSVMLTSGRYKGQPLAVHMRHSDVMTADAFGRWLDLWRETTNDLLAPAAANALQDKAARIAESLMLGIAFQRDRHAIPGADRHAVGQ